MDDKRATQIAALRRLAEHPSTPPNEAEAALERAQYLATKYNLEDVMKEVLAEGGKVDQMVHEKVLSKGVYAHAYGSLMNYIAMANNAKCFTSKRTARSSDLYLNVIGYESDVTETLAMFASCSIQLGFALGRHMSRLPGYDWMTPSEKYNHKRTFIIGFGAGIGGKLEAAKKRAEDEVKSENTGTELVLFNRAAQVEKYAQTFGLRTSKRRYTSSSFAEGREAGRRADVGQTKLGGSNRALPRS